jgi:thiosulfate/3-mercaptopyruvate sulfurtransferase
MYPNPQPLVSTDALAAELGAADLRIFDTTVLLTPRPGGYEVRSGRDDYAARHIPGAGFMDLYQELADPGHRLGFMMPPESQLVARMSAHGVGPNTRVVLYNSGPTWWATRAYFMLRAFGFDAVRVLDGGLDAWLAERRPVSDAHCRYPAAQFVVGQRRPIFVDKARVLAAVTSGAEHLVSALSPEVFSGRVVGYGRAGRIAGSVHLFARDLLDPHKQTFLPADELRRRLSAAGLLDGKRVITYCGGGISATTDAFALALLGHEDDVTIYDASMNEWGPDSTLPMESDV